MTDDAVFLLDLTDEDRDYVQFLLRRAGGKSVIIPRKPDTVARTLGAEDALAAMIDCIRSSAQDTLAALRRRGIELVQR